MIAGCRHCHNRNAGKGGHLADRVEYVVAGYVVREVEIEQDHIHRRELLQAADGVAAPALELRMDFALVQQDLHDGQVLRIVLDDKYPLVCQCHVTRSPRKILMGP
jgi:hypothetical protein